MGNVPSCAMLSCADQDRYGMSLASSFASSAAWSDVDELQDEQVFGRGLELEVSEMWLDGYPFNPALPHVQAKLFAALGASPSSHVKEFKGCFAEDTNKTVWFKAGNMNEGIWFMEDGDEKFVLKLVKCVPQIVGQTSETDRFFKLYTEIPKIIGDLSVAFPVKILKLVNANGARQYDLHVMRRIPGRSFDTIIESYWKNHRREELMNIFRETGEFLRKFHERYGGRQHCDAGPQNIIYDETMEQVGIVDLGMLGVSLAKNDVEAFSGYVTQISSKYGPEILKGIHYFKQGYNGNAPQQTLLKVSKRGGA